jgi:hypothetical protein
MAPLQIGILDHPELLGKLEDINWTLGVMLKLYLYTTEIEAFIKQVQCSFPGSPVVVHLLPPYPSKIPSEWCHKIIYPFQETVLASTEYKAPGHESMAANGQRYILGTGPNRVRLEHERRFYLFKPYLTRD